MNPMRYRFFRIHPSALLCALSMLGAGQAAAAPATYNLILKQGETSLQCARGAFKFDKAALPAGAISGAASDAQVSIDADCFTRITGRPPVAAPWPSQQLVFTGTLTIHLKNLTSKQERPVPSVYGVTGTLATSGNNRIAFQYNPTEPQRTARVCDNPSCNAANSIAVLTYHAVNTNSIPEPETLGLVLLGALGLGLARWRRRSA